MNKSTKLLLMSLLMSSFLLTSTSAEARWHHRGHHAHKHYKHHRGETCWRTNRSTGQHFRIC